MKKYELKAEYTSIDVFEVEAESIEEAERIFMDNREDYGDGFNIDYSLNRIIEVTEQ